MRFRPTDPAARGIAALILACSIWGLAPLFYKAMRFVPPLEMLSHRTIWSMVVLGLYLAAQGRFGDIARLIRSREWPVVLLGAMMISVNWYLFIRAIQNGYAVEASLGYYIFPIVAVLLGMLAFGEKLHSLQIVSVALAALAVLVLTYGLGVAPWIALVLAVTFGIYGVVKKRLSASPVASVGAEVALMLPFALIWFVVIQSDGTGHFGSSWGTSLALAFSGLVTAVPLMLLSYGSRRVSMGAYGVTQYLNPTLQFLCATLVFQEPFTRWHLIAFGLIWAAVAVFALSAWRGGQADAGDAPV